MKTLKLILFLFILPTLVTQAQDPNLDSLFRVWNDKTAPDTSRLKAIREIALDVFMYSNPDSAFYYAQLHYDFAKTKGLKKQMADALSTQGGSYQIRGNYPRALDYYQQDLKIREEISDKKGVGATLNNIGIIYDNQGDYPEALSYYRRSLKVKEEISDKKGIFNALNNIGIIYHYQGDYPRALNYFQRGLKICEEISYIKGIASILVNIGVIYFDQENYTKALDYLQQGLTICEENNYKYYVSYILGNIGGIYSIQGDYAKALEYHERSLKISEEISDKRGIASTLNSIGIEYMEQGDYSTALDYIQRSLKISEETSNKQLIVACLLYTGKLYESQKNHKESKAWCEKALELAEELGRISDQEQACKCLYNAYKGLGNGNKALEYHEKMLLLTDSLNKEETTKKLQQMEFAKQVLADSLKQVAKDQEVQYAHELEVRKKNKTKNIAFGAGLLVLIVAIALYSRLQYTRKAKTIIEKEKDRSDNLLLNILPAEIAAELKEKGKAAARDFDMVSVLFTDFSEFTQMSEKLSATELVDEINHCFKGFDGICERYGVEKIKTIGDAYMAAGGLPVTKDDSAKNTVLAGLEMADFIVKRKAEREASGQVPFEMRLGIHTGPVVAGIVGVKKFQYDIWGDTVNTASRMESSGETGKVNISQTTYELIKDEAGFTCKSRGKIEVKGKGEMEMWLVEKAK
ncbi:MAG: tetratricopeptide repeat protein [Bacteroidales bacterium]|nr:tetratricopeptide repeat protein [Bacteroidales bacterium]